METVRTRTKNQKSPAVPIQRHATVGYLARHAESLQQTVGNKSTTQILRRDAANQSLAPSQSTSISSGASPSGISSPLTSRADQTLTCEPENVYSLDLEGVHYEIPVSEWRAFTRQVLATVGRTWTPTFEQEVDSADYLWHFFQRLNHQHSVISWFAEAMGGVDFPSLSIVTRAQTLGAAARTALQGQNIQAAMAALQPATEAAVFANQSMKDYRDGVIEGAGRTQTTLEVVAAASFIVLGVAGGAVLAAPLAAGGAGLGTTAAGVVASTGATFVQSAATNLLAPAAYGEHVGLANLGTVALDTAISALTAGAGGAVMSRLSAPSPHNWSETQRLLALSASSAKKSSKPKSTIFLVAQSAG